MMRVTCHDHFIPCIGAVVSSPWSNQYYPPMDDGFLPNSRLRTMEIEANKVFDVYRKQYVHLVMDMWMSSLLSPLGCRMSHVACCTRHVAFHLEIMIMIICCAVTSPKNGNDCVH